MKHILLALAAALMFIMPSVARANSITDTQSITSGGAGSVGYTYFTLDADDTVTIETFTSEFDPTVYVFTNDGSYILVGYDEDSGTPAAFGGSNALVNDSFQAGYYIVAVSDFFLSPEDALAGINTAIGEDGNTGFGSYDLVITSSSAANVSLTPVPEPASMILLGTGLAAAAGVRHRRRKAQKRTATA